MRFPTTFSAIVLMALAGCAGSQNRPRTESPAAVTASHQRASESATPDEELLAAAAELDAGQPLEAAVRYRNLLLRVDLSPSQTNAAHRGLASAQLELGHFEEASKILIGLADSGQTGSETRESTARLLVLAGAASAAANQWEQSERALNRAISLLESGEINLVLEANARLGLAQFRQEHWPSAENTLTNCIEIYRDGIAVGTERISSKYFPAMCQFYLAGIAHRQFQAQVLRSDSLEQDFNDKIANFDRAGAGYRATIKLGHSFWISAAGFQMGVLAEELHDDLAGTATPSELELRGRRTYQTELAKRILPLVERAAHTFERTIETATRFGYDDEFVRRSRVHLVKLRQVLATDHRNFPPRVAIDRVPTDVSSSSFGKMNLDEKVRENPTFIPSPTGL